MSSERPSLLPHAPTAPDDARQATPMAPDGSAQVAPTQRSGGLVTATGSEAALRRVTITNASSQEELTKVPGRAEQFIGLTIDGRYYMEQLLAEGGMGVVFRARHTQLQKTVAVKLLRPNLASSEELTQRFLIEARAASAIGNDHIVDVTDYGQLPDGATYLVMEYLDGRSLGDHLQDGTPVPFVQLLDIALQLTEGLEHAHNAHIVHRDLKPDNILLVSRGDDSPFVKILDFGIAKLTRAKNNVTHTGKVFGTPHFMSPEQARGAEVDHRSDIYSLGVILYEMASGQLPFDGDSPLAILSQHMTAEPTLVAEVAGQPLPSGFTALVDKCLRKDPAERYQDMGALAADLTALLDGRRLSGAPQPGVRRPLWQLAAGALLVGMTLLWFLTGRTQKVEVSPAPTPSTATSNTRSGRQVALVLSPIDAHAFRDGKDLGTMPVSITVPPGEQVQLEIRQPGFEPQTVELDGSRKKMVVRLVRRKRTASGRVRFGAVPQSISRPVEDTLSAPNAPPGPPLQAAAEPLEAPIELPPLPPIASSATSPAPPGPPGPPTEPGAEAPTVRPVDSATTHPPRSSGTAESIQAETAPTETAPTETTPTETTPTETTPTETTPTETTPAETAPIVTETRP